MRDSTEPASGEIGAVHGARGAALGLLVLATLVAYEPLRANAFINLDDGVYITENPHVQAGLSYQGLAWAFNVGYAGNWHPLTWLSHMLDVSLWGLDPRGHHLTSLALHVCSVAALFLLLSHLSRETWRSAVVAGVFALHPLHVESVAWAAERKDVLSTLLGILSLGAWVSWTEKGGEARRVLALVLFALALAAKPMLVSLPFVMLLLDRWPLDRARGRSWPALVREKLWFLALALASCALTYVAQRRSGAITSVEVLPLLPRLANAAVAYTSYLEKTFWPSGLSVFYPFDTTELAPWRIGGSVVLLSATTLLCVRELPRRPWLAVGWVWYLCTLVPVIGIVQVGMQSMADRYTYWPLVGISLAIAHGAAELLGRARAGRAVVVSAALACLLACLVLTRQQVALWKDDLSLFGHAVAVTRNNPLAHFRLGSALAGTGRTDEALAEYHESLRIRPSYAEPYNDVAMFLQKAGSLDQAIAQYRHALELSPGFSEARANLGSALDDQGRAVEGEQELRAALREKPEMAEAHNDLGAVLAKQNRIDEAIEQFSEAVRLRRGFAQAHMNLAKALYLRGTLEGAIENLREVRRIEPENDAARTLLEESLRMRATGEAIPAVPH